MAKVKPMEPANEILKGLFEKKWQPQSHWL